MLIRTPGSHIIQPTREIVARDDPRYKLPIVVVDPSRFTRKDEELLELMSLYAPVSRFQPGELVMLREVPLNIRGVARIPRCWKIRFIVSAWAHELLKRHWMEGGRAPAHTIANTLESAGFTPADYTRPVIFAHGYPHGLYPNSAAWLPERVLGRLPLRETNAEWRTIVEEAGSHFLGYDPAGTPAAISFEGAPDDYSKGQNIGRPFQHEEETTHTACLTGLEEILMVPIASGQKISKRAAEQAGAIVDAPTE